MKDLEIEPDNEVMLALYLEIKDKIDLTEQEMTKYIECQHKAMNEIKTYIAKKRQLEGGDSDTGYYLMH